MVDAGVDGYWQLPSGWAWIPLGTLCSEVTGGGTPRRGRVDFFGGDFIWVTPTDIAPNRPTQCVDRAAETLTAAGLRSSGARLLPQDTVLFSSRASIGKIAIAATELCTNQGFVNLVCGPLLDPTYLAWTLRCLTPEIAGLGGTTTYREVSRATMRRFPIPVPLDSAGTPNLDAQRGVERGIQEAMLEVYDLERLLEEMKASSPPILDAALSSVFNEDERFEWREAPLEELVDIGAPLVDPRDPTYRDLPHLGIDSLIPCRTGTRPVRTAAEDGVISANYLFSPGTVIYSKIRPYLRKVAFVDYRGLCSADAYPLSFVEGTHIIPRFLMWSLVARDFTAYAVSRSGRARMPKINRQDLFAYMLRYPNIERQAEIVAFLDEARSQLDELDALVTSQQVELAALEHAVLRRSLGAAPE